MCHGRNPKVRQIQPPGGEDYSLFIYCTLASMTNGSISNRTTSGVMYGQKPERMSIRNFMRLQPQRTLGR